jgi:hypothetical protein
MINDEDVIWAYRLLLSREPENKEVIEVATSKFDDRVELVKFITNSSEYKAQSIKGFSGPPDYGSRFWYYSTSYDAIDTITQNNFRVNSSSAHATNFLGVKIRPEFVPHILSERVGMVEPLPIPANWHADIAEWASCLRAVNFSGDKFTMLELGCGWGCWMNNLGVYAKLSGKNIKVYGVEADKKHLDYAKLALSDNGINISEYDLSHGIAGAGSGFALFPVIQSGINWGGVAIINPDEDQLNDAINSGDYEVMPIVDIRLLVKSEKILDFIHVDIQGAELDLLTELFDFLCEKVKYIFIGTHSKKIEAGLFELFLNGGEWLLEMERPAIFRIEDGRPVIEVDGVQAWKNNSLR